MQTFTVSLYKWYRYPRRNREFGFVNFDIQLDGGLAILGLRCPLGLSETGKFEGWPPHLRMRKETAEVIGQLVADAVVGKYGPDAIAKADRPFIEKPRKGLVVEFDHEILGPLHGPIVDVGTTKNGSWYEVRVDARRGTLPRRLFRVEQHDLRLYAPAVAAMTGSQVKNVRYLQSRH